MSEPINQNIRVFVTKEDGSVAVIIPTKECYSIEKLEEIATTTSGYVSHRVGHVSDIPVDRFFRDAWSDEGADSVLSIDIGKAKNIKKDQFRTLRKPLLEQLDVEYMRALESKNQGLADEIAAKKQELRDVTTLSLPSNIDQLKRFIPDCLKDN